MSKKIFVPPLPSIDPPSQETIDNLKNMTRDDHRKFKKSDAYKKYVQPVLDREKKQRRSNRREWWSSNWISLASMAISLLSMIISLIALLK